jgi:hypothetical protein
MKQASEGLLGKRSQPPCHISDLGKDLIEMPANKKVKRENIIEIEAISPSHSMKQLASENNHMSFFQNLSKAAISMEATEPRQNITLKHSHSSSTLLYKPTIDNKVLQQSYSNNSGTDPIAPKKLLNRTSSDYFLNLLT